MAEEAPDSSGLTAVELNSIVSLARAVELSSLSRDVWYRKYPHLIIRLSERRCGVRLKDALMLGVQQTGG